jgi:penicillin amidase
LSVEDLARFQTDTLSLPERDIARAAVAAVRREHLDGDASLRPYVRALAQWDGRFDPSSHGAPIAWELRQIATASLARYNAGADAKAYQSSAGNADLMLLMRVLREHPRGWWQNSDYDGLLVQSLRAAVQAHGTRMLQTWGLYARVTVRHPLAMLGLSFLNGATFDGNGDSFGIHVQTPTHSQSFRAVWDVGNWDAGGMVIPSGESGEPASGHYTDLSGLWTQERLVALPFSEAAIRAHARATLTLLP